jgi:hypothetical protein
MDEQERRVDKLDDEHDGETGTLEVHMGAY